MSGIGIFFLCLLVVALITVIAGVVLDEYYGR